MDFYYALFQQMEDRVSIIFPDLGVPETMANTWDEAYESAIVELSEWLAETSNEHIAEPSTYEEIRQSHPDSGEIVPIPIDKDLLKDQQKTKRFSVVFPESLLRRVDSYKAKKGKRRSEVLSEAVQEYMRNHK